MSHPFLTSALSSLDAWTRYFMAAEIPVLAATAETLEALRANQDAVDANTLAELLADDPLMTLKVLAHVSTHRPARSVTDTETLTSSLVMMGIEPFFHTFGPQPTVEARLQDQPEAWDGLQQLLQRAHRAARFSLGFAVHRLDADAAVLYEAALLRDFTEMLLWCHAPALTLSTRAEQAAHPERPPSAAQLTVLRVRLRDLQQALMKAWRLPELLVQVMGDRKSSHPRVRNVELAVRLARHTSQGWDNPALADDVRDIAGLLNLSSVATYRLLNQLAQ